MTPREKFIKALEQVGGNILDNVHDSKGDIQADDAAQEGRQAMLFEQIALLVGKMEDLRFDELMEFLTEEEGE